MLNELLVTKLLIDHLVINPFEALDVQQVKQITLDTISSLVQELEQEFGQVFHDQKEKFVQQMTKFISLKATTPE